MVKTMFLSAAARTTLICLVSLCSRRSFSRAAAADATISGAQGGWAEVEITPPLGIGLGGRGGPDTLAAKVLDPLLAQVLYLKDSKGAGFVLVSFDLVGLPH